MPLTEAWLELHRTRFPDLPLDCGNDLEPGVKYSEHLRDWSDKATTPDQVRMERYIDRYDLRRARVLHVGIGNSGLAKRFHKRVHEIAGTTIDQPEIAVADSLAVPNYRPLIHNKYLGANGQVEGPFDFILDNNPTSPCCCIRHLAGMLGFYAQALAPDGQIVTDRVGLRWIPDVTHRRWSFDFDDLSAIAASEGLTAYRANDYVYILSRSAPRPPRLPFSLRHIIRRFAALPGRIIRSGPRRLARVARNALGAGKR